MPLILSTQIDWETVGKLWGPLGIVFVLFMFGIVYVAKLVKQLLTETIADARAERDYSRQLRTEELNKFVEALKFRDEKMVEGFKEVLREVRHDR